jgi:hypothetical protein
MTTDREPSSEALGAALIALERFPWRWWQFQLRRPTWLRSELAHAVAARVEPAALRAASKNPPEPEPSALPPHSGECPACPKCGLAAGLVGTKATTYQQGQPRYTTGGIEPGREFLTRTCNRCGYTWREQCADGDPETAETAAVDGAA